MKYSGTRHHMWKGDNVGYAALHEYIIAHKPKSNLCECCKLNKKLDLANISQNYIRDISDWEWLCRSCHMHKDGRINNLNKGVTEKTYCSCGSPCVVKNKMCMKKYNCTRRHKQPCNCQ